MDGVLIFYFVDGLLLGGDSGIHKRIDRPVALETEYLSLSTGTLFGNMEGAPLGVF